ncbi:MFS transporter [Diaphorobacter sp. HDW4B]|uniref:MFS transporter n=1 Tax=Diaphorobacter sp. HDW4B TaxID=2714925 RepID=UPI001408BF68|nr:MFS transporter [Diaphorobacter sp. HDW4B]QIL70185.1 MFS transporter [Diaphorobacter sp. HDW4B]
MNRTVQDAHSSASTASSLQAEPKAPVWIQRGTPEYWRVSLALFLVGFATFSLLYCVQPLLPELAATYQVSPAQSALALSLTTASLAISIVVAGALSEGLGRRKLIFVSLALAALCNLAASFLPQWHALLAARLLEGILLGGVPAVVMAYLFEEIDPKGLGFSMGLYVGGTAFGGMVGRIGTSVLTDFFGWRHALAALSVLDLLVAFGFIWLLPPSRNFVRKTGLGAAYHIKAWSQHLRHEGLVSLFVISFGLMGVFVSIYNYAGFLLSDEPYRLSQVQISYFFYAYIFGMFASPLAGAFADRMGRGKVLIVGASIMTAGVLSTMIGHHVTSLALIVLGIVLITAGFFIAHSIASGWVGRMAAQNKGHASSLYLWSYYMGSSILGAGAGWFLNHMGWSGVGAMALVVLAVVFGFAWRVQRLAAKVAAASAKTA